MGVDRNICVGIVYNEYKALPRYKDESLSEKAVGNTASEVLKTLVSNGFKGLLYPLKNDPYKFYCELRETKPDVLINLCEGFRGIPQMEAQVAGLFELSGIRFTGNDSKVLALCQDKFKTKAVLAAWGLPTPKSSLLTSSGQKIGLAFPLIVKPNSEDGSLGIGQNALVYNTAELETRVQEILERYDQPALVEEFVEGREFNVSVLDTSDTRALPVSEIDFSAVPEGTPHICSYEAKWHEESPLFQNTPPVCPAHIDAGLSENLQSLALKAFKALGCRDYARVDFRVSKTGEPNILEVNPNPDISKSAGYARALGAAGISYLEFWKAVIEKTLKRGM